MACALALKDGTSPDEWENVKWQTLQVSTLSIASCVGRVLIGIRLPGLVLIYDGPNPLLDRRDCRLWKTKRDEACLVYLYGGHMLPHLSVGWTSCPGNRTPTICSCIGWNFVRWRVRPPTDNHHRVVWNGCAWLLVSARTA